MSPEGYVEKFLKTGLASELRRIAEAQVKTLNERRISKNKMDFITDDLPGVSRILEDSHISIYTAKDLEKTYGWKGSKQDKVYQTQQRQGFNFWTRVLNLSKLAKAE